MILDKTLLLKGVAGVAALGGVVGGGIAAQKGGLFSSSSKNADAAKPEADTQGSGQDGNAASRSSTPESTEDDYGIPKSCNDASTSPCDLTQDELKKIKFEALGEEASPEVTVEHFPTGDSQKITLTIDNSSSPKRYTFSNGSSSEVKIKRGEDKSVTLKVGKTKFTLNDGKLKEKEVGDYGEPKDCTTTCNLYADDLEDIKFKDLDGGTEATTVTPNTGTVSLEIKTVGNTKRYIFTSSSQDVTIKKGEGKSVTLTSAKKTQFTADSGSKKLNKLTYNSFGLPSGCESTCTLTADDLKEVKFEALEGGTGNITVSPTNQTVTLTIESSPSKKYKFNNTGSAITIKKGDDSSKVVTLVASGNTEFKENDSVLRLIERKEANGVPTKCTTAGTAGCKLTADDLKEIKFKELEEVSEGTVTIEPSSPDPSITLKITSAANSNPKIYTFKNSSASAVTLKKGSSGSQKSVTLEVGDTDFKDDNNKLVSYEDPDLKKVNDKIVSTLKLPEKCKFKNNEKSSLTKECDVTEEDLKKVEFGNKQSGNLNISGVSGNIKLEIRRLKKGDAVDEGQYGSGINDGDLKITFKDTASKITITGAGNSNTITIPAKSNMEFSVNTSGELNRSYDNLNTLPTGIKVTCADSDKECSPSNGSIRVFSGDDLGSFQEVTISGSNPKIFKVEKDQDNYNLGYKFTVKNEITGSGASTLKENSTYEIKYSSTEKKWGFVKKNGG